MAYRPDYESADYLAGYADGKAESTKEWQGLTDDEVQEVFNLGHKTFKEFASAIEQALRERNSNDR